MTTLGLTCTERDPAFRLLDADRARLRRGFDLDALERLLSHVQPQYREGILDTFRIPGEDGATRELWQIGDPALQSILEEVWAPYWQRTPAERIEADETGRPGKQLALARRRADPPPQEVVLSLLRAVDARNWAEVNRWVVQDTPASDVKDAMSRLASLNRGGEPALLAVTGVVPEGEAVAHVVYREGSSPVRVCTVHRTPAGWRVYPEEMLAQLA